MYRLTLTVYNSFVKYQIEYYFSILRYQRHFWFVLFKSNSIWLGRGILNINFNYAIEERVSSYYIKGAVYILNVLINIETIL